MLFRTCLGALLLISSAAMAEGVIDIKLDPGAEAGTIAAIAKVGRPEEVVVAQGDTFATLATRKCGLVHPAYVEAFLAENGLSPDALSRFTEGDRYRFPACAFVGRPVLVPVKPGQTLAALAATNGVRADFSVLDDTAALQDQSPLAQADFAAARSWSNTSHFALQSFKRKAATAAVALWNPEVIPRQLQQGEAVYLPDTRPVWSTVPLRAGYDEARAMSVIASAIQHDGGASQVASVIPASLIAGVGGQPTGRCPVEDLGWSFPVADVIAGQKDAEAARPEGVYRKPQTVLVLDTGQSEMLAAGGYIPSGRTTPLKSPIPLNGGEAWGVNLGTKDMTAAPPPGLPDRYHGSEVAVAVLGGRVALSTAELRNLPVKVAFASVAVPTEDGPVLSARALYEAIPFAHRNDIKIINISLEAREERGPFETALRDEGRFVLVVAAAGNDGSPFGIEGPTWPAGYGGAPQNALGGNVLTVGSHDRDNLRSPFSRYEAEVVDVLAPGCVVPTYTVVDGAGAESPRAVERVGTSFSAALVSNLAAQLLAENLDVPYIKGRIIAGVDVDERLDTEVYSRGRINFRKTLNLRRDLIEYRESDDPDAPVIMRTGVVDRRAPALKLCGRDFPVRIFMKLAFTQPDPTRPKKAHIWLASDDPSRPERFRRHSLCDVGDLGDQVIRLDMGGGKYEPIYLRRVVDFIPRTLGR